MKGEQQDNISFCNRTNSRPGSVSGLCNSVQFSDVKLCPYLQLIRSHKVEFVLSKDMCGKRPTDADIRSFTSNISSKVISAQYYSAKPNQIKQQMPDFQLCVTPINHRTTELKTKV